MRKIIYQFYNRNFHDQNVLCNNVVQALFYVSYT